MAENRAEGSRFDDLKHALHTVEVEIDRYESILRAMPDEPLGLSSEVSKLRTYRGEILEKIKTLP
jgi:hypothetical protein